jgi:hypothetical protein
MNEAAPDEIRNSNSPKKRTKLHHETTCIKHVQKRTLVIYQNRYLQCKKHSIIVKIISDEHPHVHKTALPVLL